MLWLLLSCAEQEALENTSVQPEAEPVVLGKEVQALWAPIESSESKLSRHRFLAWDRNKNGQIDNNTELISFFDTEGLQAFSDGFNMLSHYFDADRNGFLEGKELDPLSLWTDIETPTLYNQLVQEKKPALVSVQDFGITQIDLQNPLANSFIQKNQLCVLASTELPQNERWLPPTAGPIAEDCDLRQLNCHNPLSITEFINNNGLPISPQTADQLPDYPMSQPLASCFPGPSHYLDLQAEEHAPSPATEPLPTDATEADLSLTEETPPPMPEETSPPTQETQEENTEAEAPTLTAVTASSDASSTLILSRKRFAKNYSFGPEGSLLTVQTFKDKTSMGEALAHDHVIVARGWIGSIRWHPTDSKQCLIDFRVSVNALDPDPPDMRVQYGLEGTLTPKQRESVKENMLSETQLNAAQFPSIVFQAYSCSGTEGIVEIKGIMNIRGVEREISFPMNVSLEDGLQAKGFFSLHHQDFDMQPYTEFFGAIRNAEELKFTFDLKSLPH